jgi:hypothetical protein
MRNGIVICICALSLLLISVVVCQSTRSRPERIELCEVLTSPAKFVGKRIKFTATARAGISVTPTLSSLRCRNRSITYAFRDENQFQEMNAVLEQSLRDRNDGTSGGNFDFVGVLTRNPIEGRVPVSGLLQDYTLDLEFAEAKHLHGRRKLDLTDIK